MYINDMGTVFNFIQIQEILTENSREKKKRLPSQFHVIKVRLCAGDLELMLSCGRDYKYSS